MIERSFQTINENKDMTQQPHSVVATQELTRLAHMPDKQAVALTFSEISSLFTAKWAVSRFASQVLIDRVVTSYKENPARDAAGQPIDAYELADKPGEALRYRQEEARQIGAEVTADLQGAIKRISRGYSLESFVVRGQDDTAAVIGSLERAVAVNPENLEANELHHQAAARHILENMRVMTADIGNAIDYQL
jgi:hypothetical protein